VNSGTIGFACFVWTVHLRSGANGTTVSQPPRSSTLGPPTAAGRPGRSCCQNIPKDWTSEDMVALVITECLLAQYGGWCETNNQ
jgi:hypothetical protein